MLCPAGCWTRSCCCIFLPPPPKLWLPQTQEGAALNDLEFLERLEPLWDTGKEWPGCRPCLVWCSCCVISIMMENAGSQVPEKDQLGPILADFSGILCLGKFAAWGGGRRRNYFYMKNPLFVINPVGVQDYLSCHTWLIHRCS